MPRALVRVAVSSLVVLGLCTGAARAEPRAIVAAAGLTEPTPPGPFVGLPPCRLVDTRPGSPSALAGDDIGPFTAGASRTYKLATFCGVPNGAIAVSLNVTVVATQGEGFLAIGPGGSFPPVTTSTINWTQPGGVIANATIVPLSLDGRVQVVVAAPTHVLIDVNGFFAATPGDGTAGDRTFPPGLTDLTTPQNDEPNLLYRSFTVPADATVRVPSGFVVRSLGPVNINGTLIVVGAGEGRLDHTVYNSGTVPALQPPPQGIALSAAGFGEYGDNSVQRLGGRGGAGLLGPTHARGILHPGIHGGGAGASSDAGRGGVGGGALVIMAREPINIGFSGIIDASGGNGEAGAGGGGGGIVILASAVEVRHSGLIDVSGGDGGPNSGMHGRGGGGGGGIIHLLAPSPVLGAFSISAGAGGTTPGATAGAGFRQGGGGGGGSGGHGGSGGVVETTGTVPAAGAATAGFLLTSTVNPGPLLGF